MTRQPINTLIVAALLTALGGCGGDLVAPEGPQTNAFLNKVDANCGKLTVGAQPIGYLLGANSNDTYFIDETSKLAAGRIDQSTYASDINAFYPAGDNASALTCIFAQLD
ncbi:MAG: hypothetical protein K9M02_01830 [Thiohalocapsa sp.]|nr:hypothetical protein [Thiohalocapsa sp.]